MHQSGRNNFLPKRNIYYISQQQDFDPFEASASGDISDLLATLPRYNKRKNWHTQASFGVQWEGEIGSGDSSYYLRTDLSYQSDFLHRRRMSEQFQSVFW